MGVLVRRFPIDHRDGHMFNLLNRHIMSGRLLPARQERAFLENMVNSRALYQFITRARGRLFLPLPYLFSTSWMTAGLAPDRTVPITCLHNEGYAYLRTLCRAYRYCPAIAFLSRAEQRLAHDLWGVEENQGRLMGGGVDTDLIGDPDLFRAKYQITEPFILYAGRRDPTKNTPLLIDCFAAYKRTHLQSDLKLVLIGNQPVAPPRGMENEIRDLGFVSREDKAGAFAAAALFCQPSVNESFSIVIMESWLNHTPVLVHRGCAVTRDHAEVSEGGLTFSGKEDFARAVDLVLSDQGRAFALAEAGRRYVMKNFTWEAVCQKYIRLLEEAETWGEEPKSGVRSPVSQPKSPRLRQIISSDRPGANIIGESWSIAHLLKADGWDGGRYLVDADGPVKTGCRPLSWLDKDIGPMDQVLVHYDLARPDFRLAEAAAAAPGRRLLIRVHGSSPEGTGLEEALAPFFGLDRFRQVLFLVESEKKKKLFEEQRFGPVDSLSPVTLPNVLWANDQYTCESPPEVLLFAGSGNSRSLEQSLKPLEFLRRFLPRSRVCLLGGGVLELNSTLAERMGLRVPLIYGLADLSGLISRAGILLCGEGGGLGWVMTHAVETGVPVIHSSIDSSPSLLAEITGVLLDNQDFRTAFAAEQKEQIFQGKPRGGGLADLLGKNADHLKEAADG